MIDPVASPVASVDSLPHDVAPPCTVWVPVDGFCINLRADLDELARTCQQDHVAEQVLVTLCEARYQASMAAAQAALGKFGTVLGEPSPARCCSRCGATFEAWRTARHAWAKQCRRCADRNRGGRSDDSRERGATPRLPGRDS